MRNRAVPLHRRFQLRRGNKMVAQVQTEATHTFSIRVPESLYRLLRKRSEELQVPQARLVVEGLKTRLESMDVTQSDNRSHHSQTRAR